MREDVMPVPRWLPAFLIVSVAAVAGVGQWPGAIAAAAPLGQIPLLKPGLHDATFVRAGAPPARYAISVPKGYSPMRAVPLVLVLHFGGAPEGAGAAILRILVGPAFEELGAVMIAPDSRGGGWSSPDNESTVNALVDAVQASYRIDARRVAVTGFSMGGAGVWHFAGKYPGKFSAAVPVAGRPPASMETWRTPVLAVHSRNDEVVPIGPTDARIKELRRAGVRADLVAVTGITHYETNRFVDALRQAVPWLRATWKDEQESRP
jgi:poly(3-hydroxybutyrate) depolymerase